VHRTYRIKKEVEFDITPDVTTDNTISTHSRPEHRARETTTQHEDKSHHLARTGKHHNLWEGLQDDVFRKKHDARAPEPPNRELELDSRNPPLPQESASRNHRSCTSPITHTAKFTTPQTFRRCIQWVIMD
jgi:hypothetical protein